MSKKSAFWFIWIMLSCGIVSGFYAIGVLDNIDFGKSIILTIVIIVPAIPIKLFIKSNDEFYD